jgi:hypothetical protein
MKTKRFLPVELSDEVLASRADDLAKEVMKLREVEAEKASANRVFNQTIKAHDMIIDALARTVETGTEDQEVLCEWVWHSPKRGMKQLVRLDTSEVVEEFDMTDGDKEKAINELSILPGLLEVTVSNVRVGGKAIEHTQ